MDNKLVTLTLNNDKSMTAVDHHPRLNVPFQFIVIP